MKVIAFFILALVGTSYASQATVKSLEKIHKDPTGAAILSMISLNMKMKGPLEQVGIELNDILNDLLAQSQKFEAETAAENERLNNAIANEQALDASYQSAVATLEGSLENSRSSLATSQDSLANNQQALAAEEQGVQDRSAAAAVDVPQFDQDLSDIANAIAACQEATQKMRAYKQSSEGSATFIQMGTSIKDKIKKAAETMQGMKKKLSQHSNMFTPLIRELIDLSSTLDQSKADKVIDLLVQLVDLLTAAHSDTEAARASYVADYQDRQAQAAQNIDNYNSAIEALQQAIENLVQRISDDQDALAATQANLAANQAELSAHLAALEALQNDYSSRRSRFDHLIALIRHCIDFYENDLATLDSWVTSQVNV